MESGPSGAEAQRAEKRKATEDMTKEAVKAMRVEEMISHIYEVKEDMDALHEQEEQPSNTNDPMKDPAKVFAGRQREFGHLQYFDTYEREQERDPGRSREGDDAMG